MGHEAQFAPAAAPVRPRLQLGKVCVAIQAGTPAEMAERAERALADAKFLEFRLDSLARPAAFLPGLKTFLAEHRDVTAIATCRRKENGGNFSGSLAAEFDVLLNAAQAGCQIVDLEVESAEEQNLRNWKNSAKACGRREPRCC